MADNSQQSFLNTLFQWTVKNIATEAANAPQTTEDVRPMADDKRHWLHEALENMTVNPIERIKLCISKIKDSQVNDQQKKEFLDELCHWAEELDLAKDFFTIGGLEILEPLLDHSNDEVRIQTCSLIANLVQNNDHCQRIVVQSGLQQKLLKIVEDSTNLDLTTKAVTAISALIRGYTVGQLQLQKYHGAKVLIQALSSPNPRLQTKLCFLINTICSSSAHMKKIFHENSALEALIGLFNDPVCPDHQQVLQTILTLSDAKTDTMSTLAAREQTLIEQFQEKLTERRQAIQGSDDQQDEMNLINQIRILLSSSPVETTTTPTTSADKRIIPSS